MKISSGMNYFVVSICVFLSAGRLKAVAQESGVPTRVSDNAFPVSVQFSPVPEGEGWKNEAAMPTPEQERKTVRNIIGQGFSNLYFEVGDMQEGRYIFNNALKYAQSVGMKVDYVSGGFELFDRDRPPAISVYDPGYADSVRKTVRAGLAHLNTIERLYSIHPFQDEPFHAGPESFDYSKYAKAVFGKRYGYDMSSNIDSVRADPKKWLDLLNFQTNTFRDGWLQVYKIVKESNPRARIVMTHDSHSVFGGGVRSNAIVAMDDVFHWGSDFTDALMYDIYPYMMFDFRYGDFGRLPVPRMSQMHYTISQLRNVTDTYKKDLGFWVGTYNKAWFKEFMGPERKSQYWSEREMAYTAVAQGANFLTTGFRIPEDARHWEDFGSDIRTIQKAGPGLMAAPKVRAKACFLFPRTQYLQLQEEYFNVGLSFELFLRSFGELDILHEEQITDNQLKGYKVLMLADVKLLPRETAAHIEGFVRGGGIVISDCVPQMDEYKLPMNTMLKLFGMRRSGTNRIIQEGHWVPYITQPAEMAFPPAVDKEKPRVLTDITEGIVNGHSYRFKVASPRSGELERGKIMSSMKSGGFALTRHTVGRGRVYLFGFCLQDTYFQSFRDSCEEDRKQLRGLITDILREEQIYPHIYSSNPDIEATVRANSKEGYVFIINHESTIGETTVDLRDLGFKVGRVTDIETGNAIAFNQNRDTATFQITAPFGTSRLLSVQAEK